MGHSWSYSLCDQHTQRRLQARYWSRVEIPTWDTIFLLILVGIHTNEFIQLLYKLYSTNSYTVWFLYQFIQFLYELYSTNSYKVWFFYFVSKSAQAASKWHDHTKRILSRISNSYKTVRSAKTSKSEKVGLPPLPRYVGTCKIMYEKILDTIWKSGLYSLTRVAYSQPHRNLVVGCAQKIVSRTMVDTLQV
jgi:hypothetical protein